jgi:hypothetical protein
VNLNELMIPADCPGGAQPARNFSTRTGQIDVFFRDLDARLIELIDDAEVVVGCVAWLTHAGILSALARKKGVSIVVQKEDFLRPDLNSTSSFYAELRAMYGKLPMLSRQSFSFLRGVSACEDDTIDGVRCVGIHNAAKAPAAPRAHHKFVVFCRYENVHDDPYGSVVPYAVWTGSFNFTKNACASFENAVVIREPAIVRAFFDEYQQVCTLSEKLDWSIAWVAPQWRVGT